MALLVSDHDGNTSTVWQPWYINAESEGVHKELSSPLHYRDQVSRDRTPFSNQRNHCITMSNLKNKEEPVPKRIYGNPEYMDDIPSTTCYNNDLPLDMSMKKRSPSPCWSQSYMDTDNKLDNIASTAGIPAINEHSTRHSVPVTSKPTRSPDSDYNVIYDNSQSVRERPSVITCTPTRYGNEASPFVEPKSSHMPPPPPSYNIATAHLRENYSISLTEIPSSLEIKKIPSSLQNSFPSTDHSMEERKTPNISTKRQLVQDNAVDPEIDEHFRRSLGTNYQQLFVRKSPVQDSESNDSVDDHFTKALGETWRKLKSSKGEQRSGIKSPERPAENNSLRSESIQNSDFQGTADVSITRINVPNTLGRGS